jgi:hypothetical protein
MALHRLLYVSRSLIDAEDAKGPLARILLASIRNNQRLAVTGALGWSGSHFVQVLEGDASLVEALYAKIGRSWLHDRLQLFASRPVKRRLFPDWTIAFCATPDLQARIGGAWDRPDPRSATRIERLLRELTKAGIDTDDEAFAALAQSGRRASEAPRLTSRHQPGPWARRETWPTGAAVAPMTAGPSHLF